MIGYIVTYSPSSSYRKPRPRPAGATLSARGNNASGARDLTLLRAKERLMAGAGPASHPRGGGRLVVHSSRKQRLLLRRHRWRGRREQRELLVRGGEAAAADVKIAPFALHADK